MSEGGERPDADGQRSAADLEQGQKEKKKSDGELISPVLTSVLRDAGVNPEDPKVRAAVEVSMMAYRGPMPLPPAPFLREWEDVAPGISQKLVAWSETQGEHRRSLERMRTEGDERRKNRAQFIALTVAVVGILASIPIAIWGNGWAAAVVAAVGVGGPLAATIFLSQFGGRKGPYPAKVETKPQKVQDKEPAG